MVRRNGSQYINGSTVFAPEVTVNEPLRKEEYEKLRKAKIEKLNREKQRKNAKRRSIMSSIALVFIAGFGLIYSEAQVYGIRRELSSIESEIKEVHLQNEALKVELIKVSGIEQIKNTAQNSLHMTNPSRNQAIYTDLSKNYFERTPKDNRESKARELIAKIKNLLF